MCEASNHPKNAEMGTRKVPLTREIFIEQGDFMEDGPKKFFRLKAGGSVRLRSAGIIDCGEIVKNDAGEVVEVHCTFDPDMSRKVKGTIQWVSAEHAVSAEVRLYDHLFATANPDKGPDKGPDKAAEGETFLDHLNPDSLEVLTEAKLEPSLATAKSGDQFQFERTGYFYVDPVDSVAGKPVFHRTATLRDTWAKVKGRGK